MGPLALGRRHSAELYFFLYNGSIVFILPFLALLWREEGFTGGQIGILSAVRPFICSISGQLLVGLADARRWHFGITVVTYLITLASRGGMALLHGFAAHLLLILASEACQSPFSIITDAAIAAATNEAGYTRKRVLASLGWGALAPLSGWIVGRWGVPHSIAVYFGLVSLALLPTLLLPLRELGRKATASKEADALGGGSTMQLLLKAGGTLGQLDSRQHNGHAAELAIELTDADALVPKAAADGCLLVERIASKASQAEGPGIMLHPLVTTADEDAAGEAVATAKAAAAEAAQSAADEAAAAAGGEEAWSIPAVGSPLAAQCGSLPPIACLHQAASDANALLPSTATGSTPGSTLPVVPLASAAPQPSALARTTSSASTAFYSARSGSSYSAVPTASTPAGMLWSPRGAGGLALGQPRSALLQQYMGAARQGGPSTLSTPHTTAPLAAPAAPGPTPQLQLQPQGSLLKQVSNVSQALNGFDQSFLEGSVSDGTYLTPRAGSFLPPAVELSLPEVRTVHPPHFLDGRQQSAGESGSIRLSDFSLRLTDGSIRQSTEGSQRLSWRRRSSLLPPGSLETAKAPLAFAEPGATPAGGMGAKEPLLLATSSLGEERTDEVAVPISSHAGVRDVEDSSQHLLGAAATPGSPGGAPELSVWAGIRHLLSNPHHAAFFATTWLMGIGYGCLGYENLYLKESGAPGILLGIAILVSTCGEMPIFFTAGWWLPKLGHELAFNVAMAGWVVRLALYTLLPLFPSPWCVLPVELLQGLTFAMAYGVGTVHAKAIAPPHLRSTTQSMFFSLYYGVGPGISGLAGGYIYQGLGMRWVFILGSATLAVGWAAIQLALRWATRAERAAAAAARKLAP